MAREPESSSTDDSASDDYASSARPKKRRAPAKKKRTARDFEMPRFSSRNGKQLPNYNEAAMDWDLSATDEEYGTGDGSEVDEKRE